MVEACFPEADFWSSSDLPALTNIVSDPERPGLEFPIVIAWGLYAIGSGFNSGNRPTIHLRRLATLAFLELIWLTKLCYNGSSLACPQAP